MPLSDDGDIVHGVGYVALYAGYLEEQIDNLLFLLNSIEVFSGDEQRWGVSKKIKRPKRLIADIEFQDQDVLLEDLEAARNLFEWRNEIIHRRIYANSDRPDELKSGRPNVPTCAIESKELYELANSLFATKLNIYCPMIIQLPKALAAK